MTRFFLEAIDPLRTAALATVLMVAASCGGGTSTPTACVPGQQVECACPGETKGVQACREDGSGFDTCACPGGSTGSGGAGGLGGVAESGVSGAAGGPTGGSGGADSDATLPPRQDGASIPEDAVLEDGKGGDEIQVDGGSIPDVGGCVAQAITVQNRVVDLYMMMDNSGSMDMIDPSQTVSRWQSLTDAISVFVGDPQNSGMMLGLDFFPEVASSSSSCNVADYTMPNVPVDVIPGIGNAQANAVKAAVQGRARSGGTPTTPALTGALQVAASWQMAHAQRELSVLFLTDGQPTGCTGNTVQTAVMAAQAAFTGSPPIKTYVLGVGPDTGNLDSIAAAGGTKMAYMATSGGAVTLSAALAAIRKNAMTCNYDIPMPEAGTLDFSRINVRIRVGANGSSEILGMTSACGTGPGWYYDNPINPTRLTLCPGSCGPLLQADGSQVEVLIGCATKVSPPPN